MTIQDPRQLSKGELFLLDWLSKEDSSAYGECRGADLDRLISLDLAWKAPVPDGVDDNYARVSLTVRGQKVAKASASNTGGN